MAEGRRGLGRGLSALLDEVELPLSRVLLEMEMTGVLVDTAQLCDKLSSNMSHKQWREWVSPGIDYIAVCRGLPVAAD